jgi:spore maturation protein CgeB
MKDFNILFFQQKTTITSFCGILWGLIELGYDVKQGRDLLPDGDYDKGLLDSILKDIDEMLLNGSDAKEGKEPIIITQDFCAVAAEAAHIRDIIYVCWPYDCPQSALYMKEALYDTNRIFFFDKSEIERLKGKGIKNLYYEPLAGNVTRTESLKLSEDDMKKYLCDVSFVGGLYTGNGSGISKSSSEKRLSLLTFLSKDLDVVLYTSTEGADKMLPDVCVRGKVNYDDEMYKVFAFSKLNLNITMTDIETGVPQRVFDIMSIGGVCLTDHQKELDELFDTGKELITADSPEEMKEKAKYYISHEKERLEIALNGYKRIKSEYNYPNSMKRILAKAAESI